ncbi:MAG: DUF4932 domain-containing protein [Bacteroidales bacterium]
MKRYFLLILIMAACVQLFAQKGMVKPPRVDERVELLSIVFRLAGAYEYNDTMYNAYTDLIKAHYEPFKDHPAIDFARQVREYNGVAYDAVMFMAIHLDKDMNPRVPFNDSVPEIRWGKEDAERFAVLLRDFYEKSGSRAFFENNSDLYAQTSDRFLPVYEQLDLDWYKTFYGKEPDEQFIIVNAPGNGVNNYGPQIRLSDNRREVYAIIGLWKTDEKGIPVFPLDQYFSMLVHEFNHSFINHLIDNNRELFAPSGEKIYEIVGTLMQQQAYGAWHMVFKESLVRAAVVKYMKDHDFSPREITNETTAQLARGFYWIEDLVDELDRYAQQRATYPTLESYMPQMAKAFEQYAQNIEQYKETFDAKRPRIVSFAEFSDGGQNVDPATKTITVHFDREMEGQGYSLTYGIKGPDHFPKVNDIRYTDDKRSIIIEVQLEPGKEYEMIFLGLAFKSTDGIPLDNYTLNFATGL